MFNKAKMVFYLVRMMSRVVNGTIKCSIDRSAGDCICKVGGMLVVTLITVAVVLVLFAL